MRDFKKKKQMQELIEEPLFKTAEKFYISTVLTIVILILYNTGYGFWIVTLIALPLIILFGKTGFEVEKNNSGKIYRFYSLFNLKTRINIDISKFPFIQLISKKVSFQPFVAFKSESLRYSEYKYDIWLLNKVGSKKLLLFSSLKREKTEIKLLEFSKILNLPLFRNNNKNTRRK